jgi:NAD(P)-dependent dehydrogenase (short-subunit alcohol dehydrogenase family)
MAVAVLDISAKELTQAEKTLGAIAGANQVAAIKCDVSKFDECMQAQQAVQAAFGSKPVSLLFNNAGIQGAHSGSMILAGEPEAWAPIFSVNVFGAVHIVKAFLPPMIEAGPLASGKQSLLVTTSSVVGLLNHNIGPYSVSKMACTALCEQLAIELEGMGSQAAHISPHSLHPTVVATNFLTRRGADGTQNADDAAKKMFGDAGATTAPELIDGLMQGLDEGKSYIIVDHPMDIPTVEQIQMRTQDQIAGARPRKPEQLGAIIAAADPDAFASRLERLGMALGAPTKSRL